MAEPQILTPAPGCRIVTDDTDTVLFAQPPEVLKGLLRDKITHFDTLVLTDIREKNGSLLNNLEFPLYFFLFIARGLAEKRKLNLVGHPEAISHAMRLLRFTLLGPSRAELDKWHTDEALKKEWLDVAEALAVKDDNDNVVPVEGFFNLIPFEDNLAVVGDFAIEHKGVDHYLVSSPGGDVYVNLNGDTEIIPPYPIQTDYEGGRETMALLQAGDIIGEMAVLTGSGVRNASVVAKTPVTVCVFAEETFGNFIRYSGLKTILENRWLLRPVVKLLPQFAKLSSIVTDKISRIAEWQVVESGKTRWLDEDHMHILVEGFGSIVHADGSQDKIIAGEEFGWRPYSENRAVEMVASTDCGLITIESGAYRELLKSTPQLNYQTRKRLTLEGDDGVDWLLGEVAIY